MYVSAVVEGAANPFRYLRTGQFGLNIIFASGKFRLHEIEVLGKLAVILSHKKSLSTPKTSLVAAKGSKFLLFIRFKYRQWNSSAKRVIGFLDQIWLVLFGNYYLANGMVELYL